MLKGPLFTIKGPLFTTKVHFFNKRSLFSPACKQKVQNKSPLSKKGPPALTQHTYKIPFPFYRPFPSF